MEPVSFEIIVSKNNAAKEPGKGICPINGVDYREEAYRDGDIGYADYAPAKEHCIHGHFGSSCAAHNRRNRMRKGKKEEEKGFRSHLVNADCHNGGVIVEKRDYPRGDYPKDNAQNFGGSHGCKDSEAGAFKGSFVVSCAKVLADKGGYRHGERHYRNEDKSFDFGIGTASGHGIVAKGVYVGLDNNVGNGDDGVVDAGRDSLVKNFFKAGHIKADFAGVELIITFAFDELSEAESCGKHLAYYCCISSTGNAPMENTDEKDIENSSLQRLV